MGTLYVNHSRTHLHNIGACSQLNKKVKENSKGLATRSKSFVAYIS
jgi:hypothetical protein